MVSILLIAAQENVAMALIDWYGAAPSRCIIPRITFHSTTPSTTALKTIWPKVSSDFIEKTRLMPAIGSTAENLGEMASMATTRPICAARPMPAKSAATSASGPTIISASSIIWPMRRYRSISGTSPSPKSSASDTMRRKRTPAPSAMAASVMTTPSSENAVPSSWLLATWPWSRACFSLLAVGSSVLSSDIARCLRRPRHRRRQSAD